VSKGTLLLRYEDPWFIQESKHKCQQLGLNPAEIPAPLTINDEKLERIKNEYTEVLEVVRFFVSKLLNMITGTPILVVITDGEGIILEMEGDYTIKNMIQQLGFKPGVQFSEQHNGTNSISLALRMKQPIQVIGEQHYHYFLNKSACYSVPFHSVKNGAQLGTISIMTTIDYESPLLLTMLTAVVDSIEREMLLRKQNRELNILNQIVTDSTKTGIILTDKDGNVTNFNRYAEKLTGWSKKKVLKKPVLQLKPIGKWVHKVLQTRKILSDIEISINHDISHSKTICLFDGMPIYDEKGEFIGAFGKFRDITERYEAEAKIKHMAYHDDLTSLPNRRYFYQILNQELEQAMKNKEMLAVFLLDLDRFKLINDTLGHNRGDLLLIEVAKRLKGYLQNKAKIFRMGGDEFTIILPKVYKQMDAISMAKDIIELIRKPFVIQDCEFHISTSIGISFYPHDGNDINSLLMRADTAMYRAKEQGKNHYMIYNSNMNERSFEKLALEKELRRAIQNNELVLYYQPQVELKSEKIVGVEALLRWKHPHLGMIPPAEFIPLAEEMGLAVTLGEWVLRNACKQNKYWQDIGIPPLRVSVNLSPQQFLQQGLVETVKNILRETGLDPQCLELEITESMAMDVERSISTLHHLNELGVQIAMDDFGTGYSSLNYLKKFSIHRLKIDRSFVNDIMEDQSNAKIVSTIISMAHGLNLEVIAEGAETKEQVDFLRQLNCDQVQGYYYSRPLPADDIEKMLIRSLKSSNKNSNERSNKNEENSCSTIS
jgi:diguanylate cyclase (GGDEF)-like protein/PAS domain S-box-containing protein